MSQNLYNRYTMQNAVKACMEKKRALWQDNEHIRETMNFIEPRLLRARQLLDARENTDTEGYTAAKNNLLDSICHRAWLMSKRLTIFARKRGLQALLSEVNHTQTYFDKGPELERIARCAGITEKAERYLPQLDSYKIKMLDVATLNADIEQVRPLSSERDEVGDTAQQLTASLPRLLQEVQDKLYELDDEITAFMDDQPDFQEQYSISRRITDRKGSHA